jgi:hypothetical protein
MRRNTRTTKKILFIYNRSIERIFEAKISYSGMRE